MRIFNLALLICLIGCTHIPKLSLEQCQQQNWREIGIQDGLHAAPHSQIVKRRKECSRFDIDVDMEAYKSGYVDGVLHRCTARYGELLGYEGLPSREEVCPEKRLKEFMDGYKKGVAHSVSDSLDPLLTKPEAKRRREAFEKERIERSKRRNNKD